MKDQSKTIPLDAIRYFTVAARHLNFNRAATEIGISPGAMSLRIKALETSIGHLLFTRGTRGVELTEDGRRLKEVADFTIRQLESVIREIQDKSRREKLTVTVSPYFGSKWLAPRLIHFWLNQPDVDLQLRQYREELTFDEMNTDILIRYSKQCSTDLASKTLFETTSVAVCSPAFLASRKKPHISIFEEGPLLHVGSRRHWAEWLSATNHPSEWADGGQLVEDIHVAIEAAASSQGVALGTRPLINDDLKIKRLSLADSAQVSGDYAYRLICRKSALKRRAIVAFTSWIMSEINLETTRL